jgi:hypothetical protein
MSMSRRVAQAMGDPLIRQAIFGIGSSSPLKNFLEPTASIPQIDTHPNGLSAARNGPNHGSKFLH